MKHQGPVVNFINVLPAAFTHEYPEIAKKYSQVVSLFILKNLQFCFTSKHTIGFINHMKGLKTSSHLPGMTLTPLFLHALGFKPKTDWSATVYAIFTWSEQVENIYDKFEPSVPFLMLLLLAVQVLKHKLSCKTLLFLLFGDNLGSRTS